MFLNSIEHEPVYGDDLISCCALNRKLTWDTSFDEDLPSESESALQAGFSEGLFTTEGLLSPPEKIENLKPPEDFVSDNESPSSHSSPTKTRKPRRPLCRKSLYFNSYTRKDLKRKVKFVKRFWESPTKSFPIIFKRLFFSQKGRKSVKLVVYRDLAQRGIPP